MIDPFLGEVVLCKDKQESEDTAEKESQMLKRDEMLARNAVDDGINIFRFLIQDGCLNSPRQFKTVNDGLFVLSDLKP